MPRIDRARQGHARASIASAAARLMAEDGIGDFQLAKKKAVRQLGLPEGTRLPDNAEVEAELRAYQDLYLGEEQAEHLVRLRETAVEAMTLLSDFQPYLTGSVLDGTAGRYTDIDLLLFADSAKDVEIFLLNRGLAFEHAEAPNDRVEALLILETDVADIRLAILDPHLERVVFKGRDGRVRERARLDVVRQLLENATHAPSGDEAPSGTDLLSGLDKM